MKPFELENHPKIKSGFIVPENYFDDLYSKIEPQMHKPNKVVQLYLNHKKTVFAIAATLVLCSGIPFLLQTNSNEINLKSTELESYILEQSSVNQDDIVELLDAKDIENMNIDYELTQ